MICAIGGEAYKVQEHTNEIKHLAQRYRHWVYGSGHNAVDSAPNTTKEF